MDTFVAVLVGSLAVLGGIFFLISGVAMFRARDAITRVNLLGPATGVGMPLVLLSAFTHATWEHGFSWVHLVEVLTAIAAMLIVSSVASFSMGRSIYRAGAELDPRTRENG